MLIIKNVELLEVHGNPWELAYLSGPYTMVEVFRPGDKVPFCIESNVLRELIKGVTFRRPDGRQVIIGSSKQSQEAIGIMYDSWGRIAKELDDATIEIKRLSTDLSNVKCELAGIKRLNFWGRLRLAFKGF